MQLEKVRSHHVAALDSHQQVSNQDHHSNSAKDLIYKVQAMDWFTLFSCLADKGWPEE